MGTVKEEELMSLQKTTVVCSCGSEFTKLAMRTHLHNNPKHKEVYRYNFHKKVNL